MNETQSEDGWRGFLELCLKTGNTDLLNDLLVLLLTSEEIKEIGSRYLIVRDLIRGEKTQRQMAHDLKVSIAKITRGSNFLKTIGAPLRHFLEKTFR